MPFQGFDAFPIGFRQLAAERLQFTQSDVQVARLAESTQYFLERRPNPQKRRGQRRLELAQDGVQSAAGDAQVVQLFRIVSQTGTGLVQIPGRQVAAQVSEGNLDDRHGSVYRRRCEFRCRSRCQANRFEALRVLCVGRRFECTVASERLDQRLKRLVGLGESFHLDALHARLGLAVRARDDGFIEGDLTQLLCLVFSADCESLPRGAYFEQWQQSVRTTHGVYTRSDRPSRLSKRLAGRVFQGFAQLPAVCDLGARGMKRFERRFRLPGLRADAQREARTMDSPVIRVQVGIEDLLSGARLENEPADRAVVGQPAANGAKIRGRELPFHFSSILSTGPLLLYRVGAI